MVRREVKPIRRLTALATARTVGVAAPAAYAGHAATANVARGLASFAMFNQLFAPFVFRPAFARPLVVSRPVVTTPVYKTFIVHAVPSYPAPGQVVVVQPAPPTPIQTVIQYPHGLRGDGVEVAWVWLPNPPRAHHRAARSAMTRVCDGEPIRRCMCTLWADHST